MLHFVNMMYFLYYFMLCDNLIIYLILYNLLFNFMLQIINGRVYWTFHIGESILSNKRICFTKHFSKWISTPPKFLA
jgi:hypothetical protein